MAERGLLSGHRSWMRGVRALCLLTAAVLPVTAQTVPGVSTHARIMVGDAPIAAAFDGENIWVVNHGSNSVTKVRAAMVLCSALS